MGAMEDTERMIREAVEKHYASRRERFIPPKMEEVVETVTRVLSDLRDRSPITDFKVTYEDDGLLIKYVW